MLVGDIAHGAGITPGALCFCLGSESDRHHPAAGVAGSTWSPTRSVLRHNEQTTASCA